MDGMMAGKFSQHMPQPVPAVGLPAAVPAWPAASGPDGAPLLPFLPAKKKWQRPKVLARSDHWRGGLDCRNNRWSCWECRHNGGRPDLRIRSRF